MSSNPEKTHNITDFLEAENSSSQPPISFNLEKSQELLRACKDFNTDKISKLLKIKNININIQDENGSTPIYHFLARAGGMDKTAFACAVVEILSTKGMDINISNNDHLSPLVCAILKCDLIRLKSFIDTCELLNLRLDWDNEFSPEFAVAFLVDKLQTQLNRYYNSCDIKKLNDKDNECHMKLQDIVKKIAYLVKKLNSERSQLPYKLSYSFTPDILFYRSYVLHDACKEGNEKEVKSLLEFGANINSLDQFSRTALHIACTKGHANIVKILLDAPGIDINKTDSENRTPLHLARENKHQDIIKILHEKEVKIDKDKNEIIVESNKHKEALKSKGIMQPIEYKNTKIDQSSKSYSSSSSRDYLERKDFNGLKEYHNTIEVGSETFNKSQLAIVEDYLERKDFNGLKEYGKTIEIGSKLYNRVHLEIKNFESTQPKNYSQVNSRFFQTNKDMLKEAPPMVDETKKNYNYV